MQSSLNLEFGRPMSWVLPELRRLARIVALLLTLSAAWARSGLPTGRARIPLSMRDLATDSLPPSVRWYLEQRENRARLRQRGAFGEHSAEPESENVRMIGKW